jgi:SAM-dependent methyltransferase
MYSYFNSAIKTGCGSSFLFATLERMPDAYPGPAWQRELDYHEKLYSGFAQSHFAKSAVRAFRKHLVSRIQGCLPPRARVLSLGCGIGDTELLLAPYVAELVGTDLSPKAVEQANADAARLGIRNFRAERFEPGHGLTGEFDAVIAIFFLHHLPDADLAALPSQLKSWLRPGGVFYALDPSRYRLSGWVGERLFPELMAKYQSPNERQLVADEVRLRFGADFAVETRMYDFVSTPLAGLFPSWRLGYRMARLADEVLIRTPGLRALGSNFEVRARLLQ